MSQNTCIPWKVCILPEIFWKYTYSLIIYINCNIYNKEMVKINDGMVHGRQDEQEIEVGRLSEIQNSDDCQLRCSFAEFRKCEVCIQHAQQSFHFGEDYDKSKFTSSGKKKNPNFGSEKCQIAQILIFFFKSFYAAGLGDYLWHVMPALSIVALSGTFLLFSFANVCTWVIRVAKLSL